MSTKTTLEPTKENFIAALQRDFNEILTEDQRSSQEKRAEARADFHRAMVVVIGERNEK